MIEKNIYKDWYITNPQHENLVWDILRMVRCHEISLAGKSRFKRGLSWGRYGVIKNALETFFGGENPEWRIFRSLEYVRQAEDGKKSEMMKDWSHLVWAWDFGLDCDSKEKNIKKRIEQSYSVVSKIIDFLDKYHTKFSCIFSGDRGFRINIMWRYRKDNQNILDLGKYFETNEFTTASKNLCEFIIKDLNKEEKKLVDTTIYSGKRPWGVEYSLHSESGLVVFPLERKQFETFDLSLVDPYYIIKNIDLRQRHPFFNEKGNFDKIYKDFIQDKGKELDKHKIKEQEKINRIQKDKERIKYLYDNLPNKDKEDVKCQLN